MLKSTVLMTVVEEATAVGLCFFCAFCTQGDLPWDVLATVDLLGDFVTKGLAMRVLAGGKLMEGVEDAAAGGSGGGGGSGDALRRDLRVMVLTEKSSFFHKLAAVKYIEALFMFVVLFLRIGISAIIINEAARAVHI